jgi:hypothetical protein
MNTGPSALMSKRIFAVLQAAASGNETRLRQPEVLTAPGQMRQLSPQLQSVKMVTHPHQLAFILRQMSLNIEGVAKEGTGHLHRVGEAIRAACGQDVPHGDQQLARDGDDGFGLADPGRQSLVLLLPVWAAPNCVLSRRDHRGAQVFAPRLGDSARFPGLAALMHSGS